MSSRANRRATRGSARSRRTPVRPSSTGPNIPWIPIAVVLGVLGVVGVIGYLVWQSGQAESDRNAAARAAEADSSADIPGQWVDLATIYGAPYGDTAEHDSASHDYVNDCGTRTDATATGDTTPDAATPDATNTGATTQATPEEDQVCNTNPPVGGPHWNGACGKSPDDATFCGPAPWGILSEPWDPETLVHNMEHGGVVIWYNTTDREIIDEIEEYLRPPLNRGELLVMAPYPDMEDETIAVTSWSRIEKFPVSEYDLDRVKTFIDRNVRRFNPESL
ncbi:MAG: DUF3105 domain-containing protein [Dehalococcoidia bacterium]